MIPRIIFIIYAFITALMLPERGYGQTNTISYNLLNPSNGLSHITVNSIYQDYNGAMWIATRDGLNCYNGSAVKVFRKDSSNPKSLASSNIGHIEGDGKRHLYLLCNEGVWMLNIATEEFVMIYEGHVDAILWNEGLYIVVGNKISIWNEELSTFDKFFVHPDEDVVISTIFIDTRNRLWIGSKGDGLYIRESSEVIRQEGQEASVVSIFEDMSGDIWVATSEHGLYKFEGAECRLTTFTQDSSDIDSPIHTNFIRDITQDRIGNIWLATDQGVSRYTPSEDKFKRYNSIDNNASVWTIMTDTQGNIWYGSYFGGVSWFNPENSVYSRYNMVDAYRESLEGSVIGRMVEDKNGVLWICTEGSGVYLYDRETESFSPLSGDVGENIKSIYYDEQMDVMWLGSHLDGLYRYDISSHQVRNYRNDPTQWWSLPSNIIRDIEPYGNDLILATPVGVVYFDTTTGRSERMFIDTSEGRRIAPVANVLVDSHNTLWIGSEGSGLFSYDFNSRTLNNYRHRDGRGLASNNLSTIIEDSQGTIWIGHEGAGVDRYDNLTDSFTNFDTHSAGVVGNRVYEICDNQDGTLSISTGEGLSLFNTETLKSYNYSPQNGYTLLLPNENAMFRSADGVLFVGGVDGLISFDVNKLHNFNTRNYKISFTSLYVNQNIVEPNDASGILDRILVDVDRVELPSNTTSFSVGFTTSNYILEINEPLEFMLEGFDHEWMKSRGTQITYTNIPAGDYQLRMRAVSGIKSVEEAMLNIHIKSEWYRSDVAYLLYFILLVGVVYYLIHLYSQRLRLSEQIKYEQNRVLDIESQNRSKLQFFTNISHEFRTPLAVIIGQIELLLRSKQLSSNIRTKVQRIHRSSKELNLLIGELLDFRKHEHGHLKLTVKEANVAQMLQELYDTYHDHIASRGAYLNLNIPHPDNQVTMKCDIMRLRKVVTNLLSNAIKYTTKGDEISLSMEYSDTHITIRVEDTGVGIHAADLQHIFDRFYQGKNSNSYSIGGTGIGLSFAKSIVELHRGTISVDSHLGRGSWFTVSLPRDVLEASDIEEAQLVDAMPLHIEQESISPKPLITRGGNRVTLLVVEDDVQLLKMLFEIFEGQYNVVTAANGREGISMAREHLPQIIVSDVMMPEVDGIELCRTLKGDLLTSHIPIVLLTARGATEHAIEGINCGADDYIVKPFSVELMMARCNNIVNSRVLLQERYSSHPDENTYKMASSALDQQVLDRAVEIIDRYIDDPDFDAATFASEIGMSRTNLFTKIKAVTGLTPNDFVLTVRLKRAATLLRSKPTMSIIEVAESVGFSGHRHFSKRFKERFAMTPGAYRKSAKSNEE